MASTTIDVVDLVGNSSIADPTATTVAASDGGTIPDALPEQLLLRLTATDATTVTIAAGVEPPAIAAGLGDLALAVAASATAWAGPFESGRFIQADGSLTISTTADVAITAFVVPKAV